MMQNNNFEHSVKQLRKLSVIIFVFFMSIAAVLLYIMVDPTLSAFTPKPDSTDLVVVKDDPNENFDKIEDGIHVRTGFVEGEGLMTVVNNCTNCHSAKLVTQNRMNKEGWKATIKWMQDTQNLWDLGKNEEIIVNYLATHYAPEKKGRRQNLANIEWYELKE